MIIQIARHWRLNAQRYRLIGNVYPDCNHKIFPPRDVCPHCLEKTSLPFQFNSQGEIYSDAAIRNAPKTLGIIAPT